jgi:hypothetical protein
MLVEGKRGIDNHPKEGKPGTRYVVVAFWVWRGALMQVPLRKKIIWHKYEGEAALPLAD